MKPHHSMHYIFSHLERFTYRNHTPENGGGSNALKELFSYLICGLALVLRLSQLSLILNALIRIYLGNTKFTIHKAYPRTCRKYGQRTNLSWVR